MSRQSAKEKEKSIQVKLKNFLRLQSKPVPTQAPGLPTRREEYVLTPEMLKEISIESNLTARIKGLRDLAELVTARRLEDNAVESLWAACSDLLEMSNQKEARQAVLVFFQAVVQGQYEKLGIMRARFFAAIEHHSYPEDLEQRFDLLVALSDTGRDILYFEEEMGPFLQTWMEEMLASPRAYDFLLLIINTVKFNSAYLDEPVMIAIVRHTCCLVGCTKSEDELMRCLGVLDTVLCYGYLPTASLACVIVTLCRTANTEQFCVVTWKLMRNLLGTHLGHRTVYALCTLLQAKGTDCHVARGCIFFLSMGLWGPTRVLSLQHPIVSVLPSIIQSIRTNPSPMVLMEVALALQRLATKFSQELHLLTWDMVIDGLEQLYNIAEAGKTTAVINVVTETLTNMETQFTNQTYTGCVDRLWALIERCSVRMPENSVLHLIDYKAKSVTPLRAGWLNHLHQLVDRFYRQETRTKLRVHTLEVLSTALEDNQRAYEEDMMDKIVLPFLRHVDTELDMIVATRVTELLVNLTSTCQSKRCLDLLDVLHRVMARTLEQAGHADDTVHILEDKELSAVLAAVVGLGQIFEVKLRCLPSSHALRAFQLLVSHLQSHYDGSIVIQDSCLRVKVLATLMNVRCNANNQVGYAPNEGKGFFSPYLTCPSGTDKASFGTVSPPVSSPTPFTTTPCTTTVFTYGPAVTAITTCLRQDKEWPVIYLVLTSLPVLMQNRSLLLSPDCSLAKLCSALVAILDRSLNLPDALNSAPPGFTRSDFHFYVFPVLAALVSFHRQLDPTLQCRLVKCLEFGLVSRCAKICINALTVCTLEMHETMYKLLPGVLLSLSKISATVGIAIPILEFLSSLIRLPRLYASFVEDQYMSIFAIALPYVNPFKFNHYTVALAYHVIAMWFLKCRLPFRRDFVKFIIKGLQSNVLVPFDEGEMANNAAANLWLDDSPRRRANSMNEQALARRQSQKPDLHRPLSAIGPKCRSRAMVMSGGAGPPGENRLPPPRPNRELNVELTETCIDLLSRYAFAACSALPRRFPASDFLLNGGQTSTWLLGTKLVTISTSGCSGRIMKQGLCDKCLALCRGDNANSQDAAEQASSEIPLGRRRHRSAIMRSVTTEIPPVTSPRTKDDFMLLRSASNAGAALSHDSANPLKTPDLCGQEPETGNLDKLVLGVQTPGPSLKEPSKLHLCSCWCQGWAEILVRHPTGNVSWMTRIQNPPHLSSTLASDFPLADISSLFLASRREVEKEMESYSVSGHRRIDSESLEENEYEKIFREHFEHSGDLFNPCPVLPPTDRKFLRQYGHPHKLRRSRSNPELLVTPWSDDQTDANEATSSKETSLPSPVELPPAEPVKKPSSPTETSISAEEVESAKPVRRHKTNLRRHESSRETSRHLARRGSERGVHFGPDPPSPTSPPDKSEIVESSTVAFRDRGHTISVANPANRRVQTGDLASGNTKDSLHRTGINPSFIFLQLYHNCILGNLSDKPADKPLLLPRNETYDRSLKCFDRIPPHETHKIGVLYVGPGQADNEAAILGNEFGSVRYVDFVQGLGRLICLPEVNPQTVYIGGLDQSGQDGKFAYIWQDDVMQVIFHVATLMPNKESDPSSVSKKLHIGNDFVSIVYNDSDEDFNLQTIKGQFTYACVIIRPLDCSSNLVVVKTKPELMDLIGHSSPKIISNQNLPILARQLALHSNLASMIFQSQRSTSGTPYASNWLERLRDLKRLRHKLTEELQAQENEEVRNAGPLDFTAFV